MHHQCLAYFLIKKKINVNFKNLLVHTYICTYVCAHSFPCGSVYTGLERRAERSFQGSVSPFTLLRQDLPWFCYCTVLCRRAGLLYLPSHHSDAATQMPPYLPFYMDSRDGTQVIHQVWWKPPSPTGSSPCPSGLVCLSVVV